MRLEEFLLSFIGMSPFLKVPDCLGRQSGIFYAFTTSLNDSLTAELSTKASRGFVSQVDGTTYRVLASLLKANHPYGCALVSAWRSLYLIFYGSGDPTVKLIETTGTTAPTLTITTDGDYYVFTFSTTIWNGITVMPI